MQAYIEAHIEGEQILPPQITPLWHIDYFKLTIFKKQQTQVFRASHHL